MLILLSPAKTLDFDSKSPLQQSTELLFPGEAAYLASKLRHIKPSKLGKMMDLSEKLANLNYERYQQWAYPFGENSSKQAVYAFKGDVYEGLQASSMSEEDIQFAQNHLCILSGLYGILRPLDAMMPYRLEMGTEWAITPKTRNLYAYWKKKLTAYVSDRLAEQKNPWILNLASQEYSKALDFKKLGVPVISPEFKEERNASFQMISFFAKKARGLMAAWATDGRTDSPESLKAFDREGYALNLKLSDLNKNKWVYTRKS